MNLRIFAGQSNPSLADKVSVFLGTPSRGDVTHLRFPSGEFHCKFNENIRGADVFLVQSLSSPVNDNLVQLLVMADAARRANAGRLTAVIPFFGYSRSDRKVESRTPIAAKMVVNMLERGGFTQIVTMDLHSGQTQGFTDFPFDNLYSAPVIFNYIKAKKLENLVIVSPDVGGTKRAAAYAKALGCTFAIVIKERKNEFIVTNKGVVGDVKGKNVLLVDDMTESLGTLVAATNTCLEEGALEVRAAVTHGLLNESAIVNLQKNPLLKELIVTNTVQPNIPSGLPITVLDVSELFGKTIDAIHNNKSVSGLFPIKGF